MEACDDLFLLFADGLDALVGFAQLNVAHTIQDAHHLLLVDHDSVGLLQDSVHRRMHFAWWFATVFDIHVFHHHSAFQRTGTIQGGCGNDVGKAVRTHFGQQVPHAAGFQLKYTLGFTSLQQSKGARICQVVLDLLEVKVRMRMLHVLDGFVQNRQVAEPQKVHLQQADLFNGRSVPLRNDVFLAGDCLQGQYGIEWHIGNHDSGRMRTGTACQTLDRHGEIQQLASCGVIRPCCFQVRTFLQRILQANVERIRYHPSQLIDSRQWHIQRAADIADRVFGFECTVGADLRYVSLAVLLLGVVDHHLPSVTTEIDVDIRRLVSAGVKEAFEQQVILQRADIAQSQQIGNDRSARGSSGAAGNAISASKLDKVPDNQEVTGITLGFDDTQFVIQPFPVGFRQFVAVAFVHAFTAKIPQVLNVRATFRRAKYRVELAFTQLHVDPIGNLL